LPRVTGRRDGRNESDLCAANIHSSDVVLERGCRAPEVESHVAIVPSSIALHSQLAGVSVVNKAFLRIGERNVVLQNVVCGRIVGDAELETVTIAVEVLEAPAVEAIAPSVYLLQSDGRTEFEQVEAVVNVVPQASVAEDVAFARAFFAGKSISALAVLAGIAVAVGVEVENRVVGGSAFELEAGFVVVVGGDELVVIVRSVTGVDTVWSVDQSTWMSVSLLPLKQNCAYSRL
jgi:hypothetical protein